MDNFSHIDLFSGCGGLSLGLSQAGWKGLFAIERDPMAFMTFEHNLLGESSPFRYEWPDWLPVSPIPIEDFIAANRDNLLALRGKVALIAGGPPCQGFSLAGRRLAGDPRNRMFERYLEVVSLVMPRMLLFENVMGITHSFRTSNARNCFSEVIARELSDIGYHVHHGSVCASAAGVPQERKRFLLVAFRKEDPMADFVKGRDLIEMFREFLPGFRRKYMLDEGVSCSMALGDLETAGRDMEECREGERKGFMQVKYEPPARQNHYVSMMRRGMDNKAPNSLRLPRHKKETVGRFRNILATYPKGKCLSDQARHDLGMLKQQLTPLHPGKPSATVTTLPEDLLHYSEPRILTVRETARLQSFPDWFDFLGNYTTGNKNRTSQCPRYTQVGNAVPPLLAQALGEFLLGLLKEA